MSARKRRHAMILVCGEALIDIIVQPSDNSSPSLGAHSGGSPLNVATGLARLGASVAFLGGISTDYFGELLIETAISEGIDISMIKRSAKPTPLVAVTADIHGQPAYSFYSHETADGDVSALDLPSQLPAEIRAIVFGSFSLAVEPIGTTLLTLAEREARRRIISLDPNLRPSLVGPIEDWRARFDAMARCAAIIKLSEEDFRGGWGDLADAEAVALNWLSQGAHLVVLTRGAAGVTAWWTGGELTLPGSVISIVDAVGAGDSFHAALLARLAERGLLDHESLSKLDRIIVTDVIRYATAAASITCTRRGADLPRRTDMDVFFQSERSDFSSPHLVPGIRHA